ncbi:MAG: hypothetical protein WDN31_02605 [Hyphomicrobium sp.]
MAKFLGGIIAMTTLICAVLGTILSAAPYNDDLGAWLKAELKNVEASVFASRVQPPSPPVAIIPVRLNFGEARLPCPECGMADTDAIEVVSDDAFNATQDFGGIWFTSQKPSKQVKVKQTRTPLQKICNCPIGKFDPSFNGFDKWDGAFNF